MGAAVAAVDVLLPSWWEIEVTVAAAVFVIAACWFFAYGVGGGDDGGDRSRMLENSGDGIDDKDKMGQWKGDSQGNSAYIIKLELLAAKNLIAANLNGTSDPYVIITCGSEKRFSSMVPGSRNPMWGEGFNFSVDELPIQSYDGFNVMNDISTTHMKADSLFGWARKSSVAKFMNCERFAGISQRWESLRKSKKYPNLLCWFNSIYAEFCDALSEVTSTYIGKMQKQRMDGIESRCRNNSLEENLKLWKEMIAGSERGLQCRLRGKLDMQDPNKFLRDLVYGRCNPI